MPSLMQITAALPILMNFTWPWGIAEIPFFLALPILLVFSGFFSGSETALFSLSAHERRQLTQSHALLARTIRALLYDSRMLLITLMLGNMTVNVLYFVISSALLLKLEDHAVHPVWLIAMSLTPLLMIIIFGEVLPKMLATVARLTWVRLVAVPMFTIHSVIGPLRYALSWFVITPLARLISPPQRPPQLNATELGTIIDLSQQRGHIDRDDQQILHEIVQLSRVKVRDVMIPRVDIFSLEVDTPIERVMRQIAEQRRTQYLIYEGSMDNVVGMLHTKQLLLAMAQQGKPALRTLARQVWFVPELQRVDQLLTEFRRAGVKMAVAVDEYGGLAGLVTLKDLMERVLGDLDMDDAPGEGDSPLAVKIDEMTYEVQGRLSVHDWAAAFGLYDIPTRVATVAGLILWKLGRQPQLGDQVQLANVILRVQQLTHHRITRVRIELMADADETPEIAEHNSGGAA